MGVASPWLHRGCGSGPREHAYGGGGLRTVACSSVRPFLRPGHRTIIGQSPPIALARSDHRQVTSARLHDLSARRPSAPLAPAHRVAAPHRDAANICSCLRPPPRRGSTVARRISARRRHRRVHRWRKVLGGACGRQSSASKASSSSSGNLHLRHVGRSFRGRSAHRFSGEYSRLSFVDMSDDIVQPGPAHAVVGVRRAGARHRVSANIFPMPRGPASGRIAGVLPECQARHRTSELLRAVTLGSNILRPTSPLGVQWRREGGIIPVGGVIANAVRGGARPFEPSPSLVSCRCRLRRSAD